MPQKTRRNVLAGLTAVTTVGLAGCSSSGDGDDETTTTEAMTTTEEGMTTTTAETTTESETANVRVAHFSPDAPNVDVYVDGSQALGDVPFGAVSSYLELSTGSRTVEITAAGDRETVAFDSDVELGARDYTIAAVGELADEDTEFRPLVLEDDNSDPGEDTARVRLVHASPDAPAVDVTLAANGDALYDGVGFGEAGYVEVPAGTYTLQVRGDTETNDGDVVAEFDVELAGNTVYTGFAGGYLTPGDDPTDEAFDLTLSVDAGAGGGGLFDPAMLRVAHGSPDAPNVDVYVDDSLALADVPFRAVSDYLRLTPGTHAVEITAAGDPDTVAFEGDVTLESRPYTVAAVGELTSEDTEFRPLVLEDDNSDPGEDTARVRLVHASPDAPAVDVTLAANGDALYDGVGFGEAGYVEVPAGTYTLQVRADSETNTAHVQASFDVTLEGGTVYSAFALGYLTPLYEPSEQQFDLTVVADAGGPAAALSPQAQ